MFETRFLLSLNSVSFLMHFGVGRHAVPNCMYPPHVFFCSLVSTGVLWYSFIFCILPDCENQFMELPPPRLTLVDCLGFICKFPWVASTVGVDCSGCKQLTGFLKNKSYYHPTNVTLHGNTGKKVMAQACVWLHSMQCVTYDTAMTRICAYFIGKIMGVMVAFVWHDLAHEILCSSSVFNVTAIVQFYTLKLLFK